VRSEATFTTYANGRPDPAVRLGARCLTAPGPRCRVEVRLYDLQGRVARRVRGVPAATRRVLRIPIPARVRARLGGDPVFLDARLKDPGGRSRLALHTLVFP
jgi:hypothetical protein